VQVVALEVQDFRNYQHAAVQFAAGCSVLLGPNGQGKTNLVEAIGYAATLGSHRVANDAPLIRIGAAQATIRITARRGTRSAALDLVIAPGRGARARINGSPLPRVRDCLGLIRAVTFAPEDLALVKGDPSERRRFLDELLVQRQPRLAGVLADCDKVLRQRAALLRSVAKKGGRPDAADDATIEVWDAQLAKFGGALTAARLDLVAALAEPFGEAYATLAGAGAAQGLVYRSSAGHTGEGAAPEELAAALAAALAERRGEEFRRGVNLVGPQRDDVAVLIHGQPAKGFASHGESWSLALAMRLASYRLLAAEAVDDGDPVLILDDVFAELDDARRTRLAGAVADGEQVIITAASPQDVPAQLGGARFTVAAGAIGPQAGDTGAAEAGGGGGAGVPEADGAGAPGAYRETLGGGFSDGA
jgi:DNA replication and repair protein RecF